MRTDRKVPIVMSFLQHKGGSGKTTLATNVAHGLVRKGFKTLLADGDPQGSARNWHAANDAQLVNCVGLDRETLPKDLKSVYGGYEVVIIDGAPQVFKLSAAAVRASDVVIIPVMPSPYDVWSTGDLVELIKCRHEVTDGEPKVAFIISRAIKNTKIGNEVEGALLEYGFEVLKSRTTQLISYPNTAAVGQSVWQNPTSQAAFEMDEIVSELLSKYINI